MENRTFILKKLLEDTETQYKSFAAQAKMGKKYYLNEDDILKTGAAAIDEINTYLQKLGKNPLKSADNRIPTNWHRIITDQKIGYLFTYPPMFDTNSAKRDDMLLDEISKILGDDYEKVIKQLGIDATNCGQAWLSYWYDNENGEFGYYFVDPERVRVIYDTSVTSTIKPTMKYLIYTFCTLDTDGKTITHYNLWTEKDQTIFSQKEDGEIKQESITAHNYGEIPLQKSI